MRKGTEYLVWFRQPMGMILFSFCLLYTVIVHAVNASETRENPGDKPSFDRVSPPEEIP